MTHAITRWSLPIIDREVHQWKSTKRKPPAEPADAPDSSSGYFCIDFHVSPLETERKKASIVSSLLVVVSIPLSTNVAKSKDGGYSFAYGQVYRFETLAEAERIMKSIHGPPANLLQRVNVSIDSYGRTVFEYEVPEQPDPTPLGTSSLGCQYMCWHSVSELLAYLSVEWERSHGDLYCIEGPRFEGSWQFYAWGNATWDTSAPPDGADIHKIFNGGRITATFTPRTVDGCDASRPSETITNLHRYEAYDCPDGYNVELGGYEHVSPCRSLFANRIVGPIEVSCGETSGNPCGILSGNKSERETDVQSDDLRFDRTYNSSPLN